MRIWDLPPAQLRRHHLLGEHRELHALWTILAQKRTGYARHPEPVDETGKRGYKHRSPLARHPATGKAGQNEHVDSVTGQAAILERKGCRCAVEEWLAS